MIYLEVLFIFIYFKIARVYAKEEQPTMQWKVQHALILIASIFTFMYAFNHMTWYALLLYSFFSFVIAGMLITAVQLGIFVDGKPLLGMHKVYKYTCCLVISIGIMTLLLWVKI